MRPRTTRTKLSARLAPSLAEPNAHALRGAPLLDSRLPAVPHRGRDACHSRATKCRHAGLKEPKRRLHSTVCSFSSRAHYSQPCCGPSAPQQKLGVLQKCVFIVNPCRTFVRLYAIYNLACSKKSTSCLSLMVMTQDTACSYCYSLSLHELFEDRAQLVHTCLSERVQYERESPLMTNFPFQVCASSKAV